jgi:hypothetical protein
LTLPERARKALGMTIQSLAAFVVAASAIVVLPDAAFAAPTKIERASGAVTSYTQVSANGCVVTSGEIAIIDDAFADENPRGVYVTAIQENLCDPNDNGRGFSGYTAEGDFEVVGTSIAWLTATVVAYEYSGTGAAPLTFELDLSWKGKGTVTTDRSQSNEGGVLVLFAHTWRLATLNGSFEIDGKAATASGGQIANDTRITVTH